MSATYQPRHASALRDGDGAAAERRAEQKPLGGLAGWIDDHRLLPNAFTQGLLYSQASARELPGYLAGHYSADGWWYYFPVAFSLKTPAALLLLFGAGLIVLVRRRTPPESSGGWFVLVPPAIYLAAAMISGINVPVRIGRATVMPGDLVFGDAEGVYFIPPALVQKVVDNADEVHVHDEWTRKKFDEGKYKSSDIYGTPKDPELKKEYEEYLKKRLEEIRKAAPR